MFPFGDEAQTVPVNARNVKGTTLHIVVSDGSYSLMQQLQIVVSNGSYS